MGEDAAKIADIVIDDVTLNAVAGLNALHDVVFHLPTHIAVARTRDGSDNQQGNENGCTDNDLAEAASCKLLGGFLLFVGVGIKLFNNMILIY